MSSESSSPSFNVSVHLPVGLVALGLAIFIASQIGAAKSIKDSMNWQFGNLDKQSAQLKDAKKQLDELLTKRDELVKQAGDLEKKYTDLLTDVLELSKTDADAQRVVEKYNVRRATADSAAGADAEKKPDGQ